MILKLDTKVKNVNGEELEMSFPDKKLIEKLPKDAKGQPNRSKIPRETIGNMLANCLARFELTDSADRKKVFMLYNLGVKISQAKKPTVELTDEEHEFLLEVIEQSTYRVDKDKEGKDVAFGCYKPFGIAQLYQALGIEN